MSLVIYLTISLFITLGIIKDVDVTKLTSTEKVVTIAIVFIYWQCLGLIAIGSWIYKQLK